MRKFLYYVSVCDNIIRAMIKLEKKTVYFIKLATCDCFRFEQRKKIAKKIVSILDSEYNQNKICRKKLLAGSAFLKVTGDALISIVSFCYFLLLNIQ